MKPTFIRPECAACLVDTAFKFLREGTSDDAMVWSGLQETMDILNAKLSPAAYTFLLGNEIARAITCHLGNPDIFKEVKRRSNETCARIYPALQRRFESLASVEEKVTFSLAAGIAGNVIDVGTSGHEFSLEPNAITGLVDTIMQEGFAIDDRVAFTRMVRDPLAKRVLLMMDNAGEIVFDKLLLNLLKVRGKHVAVMVKGEPIANDATREDLDQVGGFDTLVDEVLETSIASLGYTIPDNEPAVIDRVNAMDVVIGKGQANLETISTYIDEIHAKHVFLVSRIKCPTVAAFQNVRVGDNVVKQLK